MHGRRADDARQVVEEITPRAEQPLDIRTEHVQREHVEEQMRPAAMQEAIGEQLPHLEVGIAKLRACGGHRANSPLIKLA